MFDIYFLYIYQYWVCIYVDILDFSVVIFIGYRARTIKMSIMYDIGSLSDITDFSKGGIQK